MAYKLQHKLNKNIIGVFDEIDENIVKELITNNDGKPEDYETLEFTPEPPNIDNRYAQEIEIKTSMTVEALVDILKSKGVLTELDIEKFNKKSEV